MPNKAYFRNISKKVVSSNSKNNSNIQAQTSLKEEISILKIKKASKFVYIYWSISPL
jgi:hypothetical protein